jgi:hypothetical protein
MKTSCSVTPRVARGAAGAAVGGLAGMLVGMGLAVVASQVSDPTKAETGAERVLWAFFLLVIPAGGIAGGAYLAAKKPEC